MATRVQLSQLLDMFRNKKLTAADLVKHLDSRGAVISSLHAVELKQLDGALAAGQIDAQVHRLIAAKLKQVQTKKPGGTAAAAAGGNEATVAGTPTGGDDATVINQEPEGGGAEASGVMDLGTADSIPDEKTVITGGADERTVVTTGGPTTGTGAGTSGPSTSSWERVAQAEGPDQDVYPGMMLKERFYLEKEVGRGGMGVVYKARDERKVEAQDRNPWVAVKILNDEFRKHPQALISLQREARKSQQLTHDNILRVYDFDKAGSIVYMTMEYVDGGTVKDFIKKVKAKGGVPYVEAQPVIEGMARGLERAHRDNIVHSDFKPGNVMLTNDNIPKIFDLGIARAASAGGEAQGETTVFDAGELGALTPAYASLEMIQGEAPQEADDIYALGISTYECLTGLHPFQKKNAEKAMNEGMKPARIKGLTGKQWRTLEKALAFHRKDRLQNAEDLIEGMRPRTMADYALPVSISTAAVVVVAGLILGVVMPFLAKQRIADMTERFEQAQFAGANEAVAALQEMNPEESGTVLQDAATPVQDFFFKLAAQQWNLDRDLYDYRGALAVVQQLDTLYNSDSKRVSDELERITGEKNQKLSELNDEFNERLEAGRLFEGQENNVADTLSIVRQIDPQHELLTENSSLVLAYQEAIEASMQGKKLDLAERQLATALKVFPSDANIQSLQADVKATRNAQLALAKRQEMLQQLKSMTPDQARQKLAALLADPQFSPEWQAELDVLMIPLAKDQTAEMAQMKTQIDQIYARQLARQIDQKSYKAAQLVAAAGLKMFPKAPELLKEKSRLDTALKQIEAERAAQQLASKVETQKRNLRASAAANQVTKARDSLAELQKLAPADAFVKDEGPKVVGEAYLRLAEQRGKQGNFSSAYALATEGLKIAPGIEGLREAANTYRLEADFAALQQGMRKPEAINGDQLAKSAAYLKNNDATRYNKLSSDVFRRIEGLMTANPPAGVKAQQEWKKVLPDNSQLASLKPPAAVASRPQTSTTPRSSAAPPKRPTAVVGKETCLRDYAGFGRKSRATCFDKLPSGGRGPRLVVVPGPGGGLLAVTKYEITISQFNEFCKASGKCSSKSGSANKPVTGVSLNEARGYVAWLSENTGFSYRLPSDDEWQHAATSGGKGAGDDFNCVVMSGATRVKGGTAIDVNVGRPNPWGLINVVGNAAEWVEGGALRGGNYNVPLSRCTADWRESGGNDTAGLRLVRDVRG